MIKRNSLSTIIEKDNPIYNDLSQKLIISDRNSKFIEITKINDQSFQSFRVPLTPTSDDQVAPKNYQLEPVLSAADILLSIVVVTPLAVCCWRGLWTVLDLYPQYFPPLPTYFAGIAIHVLLATCQEGLHHVVIGANKHLFLHICMHVLRRVYTYVFFVGTILHWRGSWTLVDQICQVKLREDGRVQKDSVQYVLILALIALCILAFMKCLRNATAPPFAIALDKGGYVFRFPTMFMSKTENNLFLHFLDCIFSVAIAGNLVTIFWRGMWILFDIIFPESLSFFSYTWTLMLLGCIFVGFVFRLQKLMKRLCSEFTGIARILVADFYIVLSICATFFYWGGMWGLFGIYILPDNVFLGSILCHVVCFALMVVIGCSNSLLVRGIYKDAKEDNGECVVFPCNYLRVVFENERVF